MPLNVTIAGRDQLIEALQRGAESTRATLQSAIAKTTAILAKYTTRPTVPWMTGNLAQTFMPTIGDLWATWVPTASYAAFVEFGTAPHLIVPKNGRALFWPGLEHPVHRAHHPGTAANPFMERIVLAAQPDVNELFVQALQLIVEDMQS
jgi:hypothetical protein